MAFSFSLRSPWLLTFRFPLPQLQWHLSTPKFLKLLDLPDSQVRCTIRVAYQAADASHPKREEQARREARKSSRKNSIHRSLQAVRFPLKGAAWGRRRPHRHDPDNRRGPLCRFVCARRGKYFSQRSSGNTIAEPWPSTWSGVS